MKDLHERYYWVQNFHLEGTVLHRSSESTLCKFDGLLNGQMDFSWRQGQFPELSVDAFHCPTSSL